MRVRRLLLAASLLGAVAATGVGPSSGNPPGSAVYRGSVMLGGAPARAQVTLWSVASHRGTALPRRGLYARASERTALERFLRDDTVLGSVATDAAGSFQWRDLPPGLYRVTAAGADGHAGWSAIRELRAGQHVSVELELEPFRETLRGRVVGLEALEPPVRVLAIPSLHRWGLSSSVGPRPQGVGPDGRFSVEGLPGASIVVAVADARGLRALSRGVDLPQEAELEIDCDANQVVVEGVVSASPGGAPIAGAHVMAWPDHGGDLIEGLPGPGGPADAAGRFRLRVPKRGWSLLGQAPGFLPARSPIRSPAQLTLGRGATVRGRLLEAGTGRPVAGVSVYALLEDAWGDVPEATSDAEGRFALDGLTGSAHTLVARGAGWISTNLVRGTQDTELSTHIELVRSARIRGRLLDAAGAPVAGATVHASPVETDWRARRSDGLPYQALVAGLDRGVTGPDGTFELLGLAPGREYWVGANPLTPPPPPMHRVRAGEEEGPRVELRIPTTRRVWVKVVSASDSSPILGAHVSLLGEEARVGDSDEAGSSHVTGLDTIARGRTDAQGRVELGAIGSGELWVRVDASGLLARAFRGLDGRTYEPDATIEGEPSMTLRLAPAASGAVRGRVLLPSGAPAAEAELWLQVELSKHSSQGFPTVSREDGRFAFEAVPEGALTLRATHRGDDGVEHSGLLRDLPRNEEVVLRLSAGLPRDTLVVRVVDPKGFPVAAAEVQFRTEDTGIHSRDLVEGRAEFQVDEEVGDDGVEGEIVVEEARDGAGSLLPLGRTRLAGVRTGRTVEVRMAPELAIEGQVLDGAGKGVAGVKVRAEPVEPDQNITWMERPGSWSHVSHVLTNEEGRFRVGQLGPGPHRVLILPPASFAPEPSQPAEAGAREMRFTLRPAVRATLRVQEEGGRPVVGARVVVTIAGEAGEDPDEIGLANALSEYSSEIEQWTDERGEVRLQGLDPGRRYIVGIAPPASRTDLAEHVMPEWKPGDETIRLGRGHALAGLVLDRWGKPVAGAMVSCRRASGVDTQAHTGKDGAFRFESLPAGRVELEARVLDDERPRRWAQAKAEAGETDVVLWLVPGR